MRCLKTRAHNDIKKQPEQFRTGLTQETERACYAQPQISRNKKLSPTPRTNQMKVNRMGTESDIHQKESMNTYCL
jgi:hypothetical protein